MTPLQHNSLLIEIKVPKSNHLTNCQDRHPEPVTATAGTESRDPVYEQSLDCFAIALYSVTPLCHSREGGNPPMLLMDPQSSWG